MHSISKILGVCIILCLSSHIVFGKKYYVPRALNELPPYLVDQIRVQDKGATQKYLDKDPFGRDIIEVTYSDGYVVWDYFDSPDIVSSLARDCKNPKEVLYIPLRDKNGKIANYHPDVVDDFRPFLREDCMVDVPVACKERMHADEELAAIERPCISDPVGNDDTDAQSYDRYDGSVKDQTSLFDESNGWWPYIVIGGGGLGLSIFGIYYLFSNMATGSRYLRRNDLWSTWRPEDAYEVLLKLEPEYLANDLVHDITVRYAEEAHPIQRFFEDFQVEYDTLLQWLQFRKRLAPWCISLGGAFDIIENRLMLLDHMREAVYHWQAEQLRDSYNQKSPHVSIRNTP